VQAPKQTAPVPTWSRRAHPNRHLKETPQLVAVKIRLKRMGKIRQPFYRIVVADSRKKRDGRVIEEIGKYHPKEEPSLIEVNSDRAQYWLGVGAQPSEAVAALLKVTGDWQRFKGESGTEGTLKVKESGKTKQEIFNEILQESGMGASGDAVTSKSKPAKKTAAKADDKAEAKADDKADDKAGEKADAKAEDKTEAKADEPADNPAPADETPEVAAEDAEKAADEAAETEAEKPADEKA
jgi:small subunit ribosomal protein S16